jgi:hypothetical protein
MVLLRRKKTDSQVSKGIFVKHKFKSLLPLLIASALATTAAQAQEEEAQAGQKGVAPGLYIATDEGTVILEQWDETLEIDQGQAGFADETGLKRVDTVPSFMDWPCATDIANSRKFTTYTIDDLPEKYRVREIVERYFTIPEVIEPIPSWKDGEYHMVVNADELVQYSSAEYWYQIDKSKPLLSGKRPNIQLVSLYVGTDQVVLDSYTVDELAKTHGWETMPVVFEFQDSNVVPISYFGPNVSLEELYTAFMERKIKVAEVPMWYQGDHHLMTTIEEFEKFFEIPALDEISPERLEQLVTDIETNGFYRKPVFVTMFYETGTMAVDMQLKIRAAQSLGMERIPTVVVFVESDSHMARCGPGTPLGSSGVSGSTTPIGGVTIPPGAPVIPPLPEPEVSGS